MAEVMVEVDTHGTTLPSAAAAVATTPMAMMVDKDKDESNMNNNNDDEVRTSSDSSTTSSASTPRASSPSHADADADAPPPSWAAVEQQIELAPISDWDKETLKSGLTSGLIPSAKDMSKFLYALARMTEAVPERWPGMDRWASGSAGHLSVAWMIKDIAIGNLDPKNVLERVVGGKSVNKLDSMTQAEWAELARIMVRHRMQEIDEDMKIEDVEEEGKQKRQKKATILETERKNWIQMLPLLRRMAKWKTRYIKKHGIAKPFTRPKCIRAFNNRLSNALGKSDRAKFKVGSLNRLMSRENRAKFTGTMKKKDRNRSGSEDEEEEEEEDEE